MLAKVNRRPRRPGPAALAEERSKIDQVRQRVAAMRSDFALWARICYRIKDPFADARRRAAAEASGQYGVPITDSTRSDEEGVILVPFKLNRVQLALEIDEQEQLCATDQVRQYILKGRQAGVTTGQQAKNLHLIWKSSFVDAMTLTDSSGNTDKIFQITRRAVDNFPKHWLPKMGDRETTEISFPLKDSHFWTGTAGAKRTGMGLTLKRCHASEFAHWSDPLGTLATIGPSLNGVPGSAIVLETTASGFDSDGHNFWREAVKGENGYRALFFPWWDCDPTRYRLPLLEPDELGAIEPEEQDLIRRFALSLEQIKWRRQTMKSMGARFIQEYAEDPDTCWLAAGGLFFDVAELKHLSLSAPAVLRTEGDLRIYAEHTAGEPVVIGVDTAEGGAEERAGGDRSALVVRQLKGWKLLSAWASRVATPKALASVLNTVGKKYSAGSTPAFLIVEKNFHGITVLRELRDEHRYPLERIYHRRPLDRETDDDATERIGWATTGESLPLMLDAGRELLTAAKEGHASVPSKEAISDAFGVRRDERGLASLNSRDEFTAECLAWLARAASTYRRYKGGSVSMAAYG